MLHRIQRIFTLWAVKSSTLALLVSILLVWACWNANLIKPGRSQFLDCVQVSALDKNIIFIIPVNNSFGSLSSLFCSVFSFLVSICKLQSLSEDVVASPLRQAYMIGDSVTLSCPEGKTLQGEATVTCDPSLHFSPDPADVRCIQSNLYFCSFK